MPEPTAPAAKPTRPLTRAATINDIATRLGLPKNTVDAVLEALAGLAAHELMREGGPGIFTVPGVVKLKVVKRGASAERTVRGPRGTPILIPAKPERKAVHAKVYDPLKRAVATGGTEAAP